MPCPLSFGALGGDMNDTLENLLAEKSSRKVEIG
jgi:hypothetical protein